MKSLRAYFALCAAIIALFTVAAAAAAAAASRIVPTDGEGSGQLIFLDPGHGGEDGGAISVTGVQESGINLEISLRLRDLLRFCGQRVAMTREGDYAIYDDGCTTIAQKKSSDLRNRTALLNQNPGAILVSIHQNQFPEAQYHGAQVFSNRKDESSTLAERMQDTLRAGLDPENNRQAKTADGVYLLEHIENTAILIECGFLSNREEEAKLREEEYQKRIAGTICAGLLEYLEDRSMI